MPADKLSLDNMTIVDVSKAVALYAPDQRDSPVTLEEILVPKGPYARSTRFYQE